MQLQVLPRIPLAIMAILEDEEHMSPKPVAFADTSKRPVISSSMDVPFSNIR